MKTKTQIRKDEQAARSVAFTLRMPAKLHRCAKAKTRAEGLTFSQLVQRAILHELIRTRTWQEVAMIDFTGCEEGDCPERIIYKTPDGGLQSVSMRSHEGEVIEDVTREQVARWIHKCVIPEEFEADFRVCPRGDAA